MSNTATAAARFAKAPAGRPANAATAAGDDNRFVLKAAHGSPLLNGLTI